MLPLDNIDAPVCAGMDIGGTHVAAALHDARTGQLLQQSLVNTPVDSSGPAGVILDAWAEALDRTIATSPGTQLVGVGIAMPGPFEYDNGVSRIRGLAKYDALYGMNIRRELKARLGHASQVPILFRNDASCFLLGEGWIGAARDFKRVIGITLGTGLGSAFMADGKLVDSGVDSGDGVPPDGWLYPLPFRGMPAEEWFSARGLTRLVTEKGISGYPSLREYAEAVRAGNEAADVFQEYGRLMGEFLSPWISRFAPECLVIGGNISRSIDLFGPSLESVIDGRVAIRPSALLEEAALAGAASLPLRLSEPQNASQTTTS